MAKKQAVEPENREQSKVGMQLRLDAELHEKLRLTAEEAGISLNQLIQGICWGVMGKVVQGEGIRQASGYVHVQPRKKCLFFGRSGSYHDPREMEELRSTGIDPVENDNGELWFGLDFTDRGVVR